ncbi:MAG TPA: hypothetical protein VIT92_00450 [Burkholderiaceae bacterium]
MVADILGPVGGKQRALVLDTVHIDLDASLVTLAWRLTLDQREGIDYVQLRRVSPEGATQTQEAA